MILKSMHRFSPRVIGERFVASTGGLHRGFSVSADASDPLVRKVISRLQKDKHFVEKVIRAAPPEALPRVVKPVAGHIARELSSEFSKADVDGDKSLTLEELRLWYAKRYPSFSQRELSKAGLVVEGAKHASGVPAPISRQLARHLLRDPIRRLGFWTRNHAACREPDRAFLGTTLGLSSCGCRFGQHGETSLE